MPALIPAKLAHRSSNACAGPWPEVPPGGSGGSCRRQEGQVGQVLPRSPCGLLGEARAPSSGVPFSKLSEVREERSCTARLQILPQATKFISKKKFLSAQC